MFWLALGKPKNWISSFNSGSIWGLKTSQTQLWNQLKPGDTIFFYVTSPISGIIGEGKISTSFRQEKPLWPEEVQKGEVLWPLRFQFDILKLITREDWEEKKVKINDLNLPLRSGFQGLSQTVAREISERLAKNESGITSAETLTSREPIQQPLLTEHNRIRDTLVEMGRLQGYFAEKEFPMDGYRLDAVWRRIYEGSPTYVFEVQVGGSVEQAIGKLKHAFDKWNSRIFIVLDSKDEMKVKTLLSGTFHEISKQIRVVKLAEIDDLYKMKRLFKERERILGLN